MSDYFTQDELSQAFAKEKENYRKRDELEKNQILQEQSQLETDYRQHMFDSSYFGGDEEATRIITSYKKEIEITDDEVQTLKKNMYDRPDFELLNREQYNNKNCIGRWKYRRKIKKYFKRRNDYQKELDKKNVEFKNKSEQAKKLHFLNKSLLAFKKRSNIKKSIEKYKEDGLFEDIAETTDAIETAYQKQKTSKEFMQAELDLGLQEASHLKLKSSAGANAIEQYTRLGGPYVQMNHCLRNPNDFTNIYQKQANDGKEAIAGNKLNRDLVVRRGVQGTRTLAYMLGLDNASNMSMEDIKDVLNEKIDSNQEIILSDSGFISTSLPFTAPSYSATSRPNDAPIGIEFIILVKKGTSAVNATPFATKVSECELILKPGTKFRLVSADTSGDAQFESGEKGSWKIYLTTVPPSEDGELKEEAS